MKKFSTAALALAFAAVVPPLAHAQDAATKPNRCAFLPTAPDQHTVVRGDTLWGISGRFLQNPWCWPEVWGMNRDQIRDPHWIYPGQVVYLDRAANRLRLGSPLGADAAGGLPTHRLSPQIRTETLARDAVPAIPANVIEPFLSQPLIVGESELQQAARIVATREERVMLGKDDLAYALGDLQGHTSFHAFRPAVPLRDPESGAVIGYEATFLGTLKLERTGRAADEAHTLRVVSMKQEMGVGDRLLPVPPTPLLNYVPHSPAQPVDGRIASIYGGVSQAGQNQVVSINRGRQHGLELGHVLELYRFGGSVPDRTEKVRTGWFGAAKHPLVRLPDHRYGSLFVFRVFDNISYGLVMEVTDSVQVGDVARAPE